MKLSILIPSIEDRADSLKRLTESLYKQKTHDVEIVPLVDKRGETSTGMKRNQLIESTTGEYFCFIDDDDDVSDDYVKLILRATESNPDVIPINGFMTTNGKDKVFWEMGLGLPYKASKRENGTVFYERFPNHLAVMKRELVNDYKFKDTSYGEDYEWAKRINDDKVFKTEVRIKEPIYHYVFTK